MVSPITDGQTCSAPSQLKITEPESKPPGQSTSAVQSRPQNEPVWPSPMKVRQWPVVPQLWPIAQSSQSARPECVEQVPVGTSQNWLTGQPSLMRQKSTHWPIWQA